MISADMIAISAKQLAVVRACKCIIKVMNSYQPNIVSNWYFQSSMTSSIDLEYMYANLACLSTLIVRKYDMD